MTDQFIIHIVREAFYNVLLIVGPLLIVSLIVGLIISIFQAATSISEQTLTFVPKILSVVILIVILLPFMLSTLKTFVLEVYSWIPRL
ncbi:MAG TPA: flagellar biosynthesis protein FliQ [Candidatus Kapabacteria bacterium]|jgi:flagellar biosynthetic protein FliQ|nr:flagellar biosynthesis protein FliQ [Candidatus Kapabacteria bacterium]HPP39044.1 flagellar biosynthesis protein FliQ [Candidatus Kapabacteria bacterium]HPU24006.1 flagellar biosynthesis protein FliQ [Candidatus Kapabacteria bacterium]